jgi:Protein of unknown function (DUF2804)
MRELLDAPTRLVDGGRIHFGTCDRPIADVNLIDAQPWSLPLPRPLRALRLKEWQAFQLGNPRWFIVVALFDAKLLALAQVKIYDRERRSKHVFERKLPSWAMKAPRNVLDSEMRWAEGAASMRFLNRLAADRIELELELPATDEMPALSGSITLAAQGCEPQVVSIPFGPNRGMYSHKACLVPEGELRLGDEVLRFSPADGYALMDDHKGYYPYVMRWDWVTGGGIDSLGRRIGFNLTHNDSIDPERFNENCVWVDGRRQLLPPVRFVRRPELQPEVWEVRDQAGEVAVDFVIELDGHVRVGALVVESRYRGPFGRVQGHVRGPAGERIVLDGMFGMGEDFYLRC